MWLYDDGRGRKLETERLGHLHDDNVTYTFDDITYLRFLLAWNSHLLLSPESVSSVHL